MKIFEDLFTCSFFAPIVYFRSSLKIFEDLRWRSFVNLHWRSSKIFLRAHFLLLLFIIGLHWRSSKIFYEDHFFNQNIFEDLRRSFYMLIFCFFFLSGLHWRSSKIFKDLQWSLMKIFEDLQWRSSKIFNEDHLIIY